MSTDMNKQYEELRRLITQRQLKQRVTHDAPVQLTASGDLQLHLFSKHLNHKHLLVIGRPLSSQMVMCIHNECHSHILFPVGTVGSLDTTRNCPMREQGPTYPPPPNDVAIRSSTNHQDKTNVYLRMTLLYGKEVPCLVDSGCEMTLVPKTLTNCFSDLDVWPSSTEVWAADSTTIPIFGEVAIYTSKSMYLDICFGVRQHRRGNVRH